MNRTKTLWMCIIEVLGIWTLIGICHGKTVIKALYINWFIIFVELEIPEIQFYRGKIELFYFLHWTVVNVAYNLWAAFSTGVNFINILHVRFFVRKWIDQLFSSYKPKTQLCNFWRQNFVQNVDEVDSRIVTHFTQKSCSMFFKATSKMLMKLTRVADPVKMIFLLHFLIFAVKLACLLHIENINW